MDKRKGKRLKYNQGMAKRKFYLTDDERRAIEQAERQTRDAYELRRLQAVRLYGIGETVASIQKLVGCGPASPRQWACAYRQDGMAALHTNWASGNANKLTAEQRQDLFLLRYKLFRRH